MNMTELTAFYQIIVRMDGHISAAYLTNRKEKLKDLFEQSFKEQMHELYNK